MLLSSAASSEAFVVTFNPTELRLFIPGIVKLSFPIKTLPNYVMAYYSYGGYLRGKRVWPQEAMSKY